MAPSKLQILKLFKSLMRESSKFSSYNFRMYGLRKVRDSFRTNRSLTDSIAIDTKYSEGIQLLDIIKRQVIVQNLFKTESLVIEKNKQ